MGPASGAQGRGSRSRRRAGAPVRRGRVVSGLLLALVFLINTIAPTSMAAAQTPTPGTQAQTIFNRMTPAERLGQLFLVTFTGTDTSTESYIHDLIANHHIGGVILSAANDNFSDQDTIAGAQGLIESLQRVAWDSSLGSVIDPASGQPARLNYVPLWIGLSQEGNGYPYDQVLSGLTPLPSEMALGATWNPTLASQAGQVMGRELSTLGINLYLGPSLDVIELPNPSASGDLGTRAFGGDPTGWGRWDAPISPVCIPAAGTGWRSLRSTFRGAAGRIVLPRKKSPPSGNRSNN